MCFGGGLNHLHGDSPSRILLANHLALSGSESIFGLTRALPCVYTSVSQDGVQLKGLWAVDKTYYGLSLPFFSDP